MANPFNIDQLRLQIEALIREHDLGEDESLRADMLDGATDMNEALSRLFTAADNDKGKIKTLTDQINTRTTRRKRLAHRIDMLRGVMLSILQSANLRKVELPEVTLVQRKSQPQLVGEPDVELLPDDLIRVKREADLVAIREALLAGREVPGVWLSNAAPSLQINAG